MRDNKRCIARIRQLIAEQGVSQGDGSRVSWRAMIGDAVLTEQGLNTAAAIRSFWQRHGSTPPDTPDEPCVSQNAESDTQTPLPSTDETQSENTLVREVGRENRKLRAANEKLRAQLRIEQEQSGSFDDVASAIREIVTPLPTNGIITPPRLNSLRERIAILLWSDWHSGEVVHPSRVDGLNAYNMDICARRVWTLVRKTIALLTDAMQRCNILRIVITLGGDMNSGGIHEDLRESNEADSALTSVWTGALIGQAVWHISRIAPIDIVSIPGNHGRLSPRKKYKYPTESWDWVSYAVAHQYLSNLIDNGRVRWDLRPRWVDGFVAHNRLYLTAHGDEVKGQLGIPYYGLDRYVARLRRQQQSKDQRSIELGHTIESAGVYRLLIGHFHQFAIVKDVVINGTLKGVDEYSNGNAWEPVPAMQIVMFDDAEYGLCQIEPLYLDNPYEKHEFALPDTYAWREADDDALGYTVAG